jgi:hypothetical protein
MGAHRARQTSTVGKVAGRGALTAAAALALTGGTASFAFADEANFDATSQATESSISGLARSAEDLATNTDAPQGFADAEGILGDHEANVEHKVADISGAGAGDLQDNLNANGVPVGDHITDGEHALVNAVGGVSEQVHGATGAGAHALDEQASMLSFS